MSKIFKMQSEPESVSVEETKYLIKSAYKQRLSGLKEKPIFIFGHRGIGKTQIIPQTASELSKELGFDVVVTKRDLSTMEAPDFRGLSEIIGNADDRRTVNRPHKTILPPNDGRGYIIHFDEANRPVDESVYSALLTLLDEFRIEDQYLGNKVFIVLTGNPAIVDESGNDVYHNIKDGDPAFNDRIKRLMLKTNFIETKTYLSKKYKDNELFEIICENPDLVCYEGIGMSPRTLESALIKYQSVVDKNMIGLELRVILGNSLASHLLHLIQMKRNNLADASLSEFLETEVKNKELISALKQAKSRGDYITRLTQQAHSLLTEWYANSKNAPNDKSAFLMNVLLTIDQDKLLSFYVNLSLESGLRDFLLYASQKADLYKKKSKTVADGVIVGNDGYYKILNKTLLDFSTTKASPSQRVNIG